jgi:hypothetical protein
MTFVKKQLTPFSSAAADPLFNFTQPFIQQGVISGRYYSAEEVAYGNPKPGYLEPSANSDVVTVVASTAVPLRLVFALGLHDANTGGEIGSWRTFTGKSVSNVSVTVSSSEKGWIYAEINENGQPNNPGAWTIAYANEPAKDRIYSAQVDEPVAPVDGNIWFSPITNLLKKYNEDTSQWETKKRVYLGEAGIGNNGYVYSVQSWYPELGYAQYQDSFYEPYYENPWRHYDGVSFLTDGQYTAMEAANWANNATIGQAVAGNQIAMNAVANSATAMDNITQAANTMNAVANSLLAIQALEANTSAISFIVNSSLAMNRIANTPLQTVADVVASNAAYITQIANSTIAVQNLAASGDSPIIKKIANTLFAQQTLLTGTANLTFLNAVANNNAALARFGAASTTVDNVIYSVISTNSTYQTLIANAQGQLLTTATRSLGPILASGGTEIAEIVASGTNYRVHRFNGTSSLSVNSVGASGSNVEYVIVAGGGGGGGSWGGGGGAGGYRSSVVGESSGGTPGAIESRVTLATGGTYTTTIGGGGPAGDGAGVTGGTGGASSITSPAPGWTPLSTVGGGGGRGEGTSTPQGNGGSGGGQGSPAGPAISTGTPGQGHNGGQSFTAGGWGTAGGGGAGAVGGNTQPGSDTTPVAGGAGRSTSITGTPLTLAAGGSGIYGPDVGVAPASKSAPSNSGGGAKGGSATNNGNGGSGIVIVRYPIQKV